MARSFEPIDRGDDRLPSNAKREGANSRRAVQRRSEPDDQDERIIDWGRARADQPDRPEPSCGDRLKRPLSDSRRSYQLSTDERETLADLGKFRVIAAPDLAEFRYGGREAQLRQDTRSLLAQGLIQSKTVWTGQPRTKETFYSLTPLGKRLAKREVSSDQALYAGFVKPAELRHDAAIYRMYQREVARIVGEGGRIGRVVLDYELKKKAYSPLAKAKTLPPAEYIKRQAEIAAENGLKVVNGHIALPDLRIEFETRSGGSAHVDLEVASGSYHGSHAAEKAAAGFRMYASQETVARLTAALEEREITAEILAL